MRTFGASLSKMLFVFVAVFLMNVRFLHADPPLQLKGVIAMRPAENQITIYNGNDDQKVVVTLRYMMMDGVKREREIALNPLESEFVERKSHILAVEILNVELSNRRMVNADGS